MLGSDVACRMKYNLCDPATVKLTERGIEIFNGYLKRPLPFKNFPQIRDDNSLTMSLKRFMVIFGRCYASNPTGDDLPFEDNEIDISDGGPHVVDASDCTCDEIEVTVNNSKG